MGMSPIIPTTVEGIKRLAKAYARRMGLPHHVALERASMDAGFASYAVALRAILRPANNDEVPALRQRSPRKTLLTQAIEAFEAGDYPMANALARRVQRNNSRDLAAYPIIARTEVDDFERRWILLKGERAAQKLATPVPISEPGYMAPEHFKHFAQIRSLLARDYWRVGASQNRPMAIELCKEILWRDLEDSNGLRFDYYSWCMDLYAHTAVAGMLELRGPRDLPSEDLDKLVALMRSRGDEATAGRLLALAAENV